MEKGVFRVFRSQEELARDRALDLECPELEEFIRDLQKMCSMIADGPLKTFCYKRLTYLSSKFQLHSMLNEIR